MISALLSDPLFVQLLCFLLPSLSHVLLYTPSCTLTFTHHVAHAEASSQPLRFEKGNSCSLLLPQLYFIELAALATAITQASRRASTLIRTPRTRCVTCFGTAFAPQILLADLSSSSQTAIPLFLLRPCLLPPTRAHPTRLRMPPRRNGASPALTRTGSSRTPSTLRKNSTRSRLSSVLPRT